MKNKSKFENERSEISKDKSNKHPHHDLIVEWVKDTSKAVEILSSGMWHSIEKPNWDINCKYRFKPREFVKGHWYPCLDDDEVSVNMWDGKGFTGFSLELGSNKPSYYNDIGESLGEIKFSE